jgi:hypothetical protein
MPRKRATASQYTDFVDSATNSHIIAYNAMTMGLAVLFTDMRSVIRPTQSVRVLVELTECMRHRYIETHAWILRLAPEEGIAMRNDSSRSRMPCSLPHELLKTRRPRTSTCHFNRIHGQHDTNTSTLSSCTVSLKK